MSSARVGLAGADALAAAALACPSVVALSGGRVGEVATYLPGRRVTGVRVTDGRVEVHVVARYGPTCAEIASQVRAAVQPLTGGLPVWVGIDDLDTASAGVRPAAPGPARAGVRPAAPAPARPA